MRSLELSSIVSVLVLTFHIMEGKARHASKFGSALNAENLSNMYIRDKTLGNNTDEPHKSKPPLKRPTHNMELPNVEHQDLQRIGIEDSFLSLRDDLRDDLRQEYTPLPPLPVHTMELPTVHVGPGEETVVQPGKIYVAPGHRACLLPKGQYPPWWTWQEGDLLLERLPTGAQRTRRLRLRPECPECHEIGEGHESWCRDIMKTLHDHADRADSSVGAGRGLETMNEESDPESEEEFGAGGTSHSDFPKRAGKKSRARQY